MRPEWPSGWPQLDWVHGACRKKLFHPRPTTSSRFSDGGRPSAARPGHIFREISPDYILPKFGRRAAARNFTKFGPSGGPRRAAARNFAKFGPPGPGLPQMLAWSATENVFLGSINRRGRAEPPIFAKVSRNLKVGARKKKKKFGRKKKT